MPLTIRKKVFLGTVTVSLSFILISILVMVRFLGQIADAEITHNLQTGKVAYERFTRLRYDLMTVQARSMAQTPYLQAVMNISDVDPRTVFSTAEDLHRVGGMDLMLVVDAQGKFLADLDDSLLFGQDLLPFPGVETGLKGRDYNGIWEYRDNLYRVALTPIITGNQVVGLLILGGLLDAVAATEIRESTGRDALLLYSGKLIAQSTNPASPPITYPEIATLVYLLEQVESSAPPGGAVSPFRITFGGKACLALALPLVNDKRRESKGYTVLYRALAEVDRGVNVLRISIMGAGGVSMLLAVSLSVWLSARVSRPILSLRAAAEQFGAGKLDKRVTVHSEDELGQLGAAFNRMAADILSAQRALENEQAYTENV
ncbi:HAMP domain-containing protein, partial [Candidatus Poribacteria bacterium]|nr:HAMP domain-containing protein [Candidatus Poribacteria bacterium]